MTTTVEHLKKVTLELRVDTRKAPFEFIIGAASEGLCPFEIKLLHKTVGDRFHLSIPQALTAHTFAHLHLPLFRALELDNPLETLDLAITVVSLAEPAPREVVRALAQATEQHGCGGDCGCGCGGR